MTTRMSKEMVLKITKGKSQLTLDYFKYASKNGFTINLDDLMSEDHLPVIGESLPTLMYLIKCANTDSGQCNPAIETIVQHTGRSKATVKRDTAKLKSLGYIDSVEAPRNKAKQHVYSNNYIITVHLVVDRVKQQKLGVEQVIAETAEDMVMDVIEETIEAQPEAATEQVQEEVIIDKGRFVPQTPVLIKKAKQEDSRSVLDIKNKIKTILNKIGEYNINREMNTRDLRNLSIEQLITEHDRLVQIVCEHEGVLKQSTNIERCSFAMYDGSRPYRHTTKQGKEISIEF